VPVLEIERISLAVSNMHQRLSHLRLASVDHVYVVHLYSRSQVVQIKYPLKFSSEQALAVLGNRHGPLIDRSSLELGLYFRITSAVTRLSSIS
jgi:hypothetical protein